MVVFPLPGPPEMTIFLLCLDEEAITYDFSYICIKIARLMLSNENPEEFYSRFHEQLLASQKWPGPYLFKFILRDGETDENVLTKLFDGIKSKIHQKAIIKKNLYLYFCYGTDRRSRCSNCHIQKSTTNKGAYYLIIFFVCVLKVYIYN